MQVENIHPGITPELPYTLHSGHRHHSRIINHQSIGICIGASTISIVKLSSMPQGDIRVEGIHTITGYVNPKDILMDALIKLGLSRMPMVVTGRKFRKRINLTSISESEATEAAIDMFHGQEGPFTALASLGAETFVVYELDNAGKIRRLISKNQCASGTGEFFMQQIGRMNLNVDEAVSISRDSDPFKVSGRCSVFCKSDCTHALNKGIPKDEVAAGLAFMIAEKADELLRKARSGRFMIVGGVTQNTTVMDFLRKNYPDLYIPAEATFFEALGAAVHGLHHEVTTFDSAHDIFVETESLFTFHKPLTDFIDQVKFSPEESMFANHGDECILGLDVGSTTTKGVIIRTSDNKVLAKEYLYTHGNPVRASRQVYESMQKQIDYPIRIVGLGVTGSGRHITALHAGTKGVINEISAHARASVFFDPEVDTIFEIGGQDAKYTYIDNKVPADYAMNEACSAGTGSFIQEAAFESLKVKLEDIEPGAFKSKSPLNFRDQCAAFIGSDIKSALQENYSREDVLAGLVYSICLNYINRVKGKRPVGKKIFMQGGVCYNKAIPVAMAAITGKEIVVPPFPGLMGAFGTALKVKEELEAGLLEKGSFVLGDLIAREFSTGKSFICLDKANGCDRKCEINTFRIDGKAFAFGGACNKYYDALTRTESNWQKNDFVGRRMERIFSNDVPITAPVKAKTIGVNQTFTINRLYPLYQTFFTQLGFKVVLPTEVDQEGFENQHSSFCYPVELAHGLFSNLISKGTNFIFMPEIYEMHVPGCEKDEPDSCATCVFISKEANYLSQAFKSVELDRKLLHPYLNFAKGYRSQKHVFMALGKELGIRGKRVISDAFEKAVFAQEQADMDLLNIGKNVLKDLEANPEEVAIVLVGRDYNSFSELANKGIPKKFASLGYKVIPYDILDSKDEEIISYQSWEAGKRILRAAQTIKKHPQLFPVYISNFSCGPDSFLIPIFRSIMENKPSLTLELDQHTADAGINTRIDAFLDVVRNFRLAGNGATRDGKPVFRAAEIRNLEDNTTFVDSDGVEVSLKDKSVKLVVPCIGDLVSAMFAASLRSLGYNAIALPEMEPEILDIGLRYASGKECLPVILLAGSVMDYVENQQNGDKIAFFNIGGTSACRVAQYPIFLTNLVKAHEVRDVAMLTLIGQDGYLGLTKGFLKRSMEAIIMSDVLEDVRSGILANAIDPVHGLKMFDEEFAKLVGAFSNDYENVYDALKVFSEAIARKVPYRVPVTESKYVALTGEIFIRHNQFAHKRLNHYFGKRGFILKNAYISEWVKYVDYAWRKGEAKPWVDYRKILKRLIREQYITLIERKMQKILVGTGYLHGEKTHVADLVRHSLHVLPLVSTGEPALTLGTALSHGYEKYCGVINIGPFGCLQTRIGEAVSTPNMTLGNKKQVKDNIGVDYCIPTHLDDMTDIPFLTIECDGKGYPQIIESRLETFLVQVERAYQNMKMTEVPE